MNNKKKLDKAIKSAREKNQKVALLIDKVKTPSNEFFKIIFAYMTIVMEHHKSIIELTNVRQISALALIRPLYEAYIRIHWLGAQGGLNSEKVHKAFTQLVHDVEDGKFPTLKVMCEEIDEVFEHNEDLQNVFSLELEDNKKLYHSFTHGGAQMIALINNPHDKFTYKEMRQTLEDINLFMYSSVIVYSAVTNDIVLGDKVHEIMLSHISK